MNSSTAERFIAKSVGIGAFLTTVLVYTSVSDPVNVPKMVVLAVLAFGSFGALAFSQKSKLYSVNKPLAVGLFLFLLTSIWAVIQSPSPFNQNFFGTYVSHTRDVFLPAVLG